MQRRQKNNKTEGVKFPLFKKGENMATIIENRFNRDAKNNKKNFEQIKRELMHLAYWSTNYVELRDLTNDDDFTVYAMN